ncbi:cupredoxin domain-containing protein [Paenibacillus sp. ACRRX]|uniref:cupredoxin domain-containing protein n=1 Tax=unclassified Paenibacillus TaxID=185978 RepID=UPI001EF5C5EB|nr:MULTISPECIES: cupredoxin domain-containing protein [unclassified Paenibacillus]MCG7409757.1 cupredoxin domain-containing protein [Paenibacillus sp. ACRRX]MDK8183166.1 cupredoxin domain-containing protein [Paenibacillus sp. UMB4589-SE434]
MTKLWVVSKKQWRIGLIALAAIMVAAAYWRYESLQVKPEPVAAQPAVTQTRVLHMVTGEFKSVLENGKESEVYVFSPGTVFANEGEKVELRIRGVSGKQHDFTIEGLDLHGSIYKNKETVVTFQAKEGIYRILCHSHGEASNEGPMIGYIVVD